MNCTSTVSNGRFCISSNHVLISLISNRTLLLMEVKRKTFLFTNQLKEAIMHIYRNFDRQVYIILLSTPREQKWRSGESTRLSPIYSGFKSRHRPHIKVEFVISSLPCSERLIFGCSGFSLSSKTNNSKFQFEQESGRRRTTQFWRFI